MRFLSRRHRLTLLPIAAAITAGVLLGVPGLPSPVPPAHATTCGVEAWSVKTGSDPDAAAIATDSTTATTIQALRAIARPGTVPANSRVAPTETTVYGIQATVTQYKLEDDGDYHLIVSDGTRSLIIELPDPACVDAASPLRDGIVRARAAFDGMFSATTSYKTASVPVTVRGVGFFDYPHGQTGYSPNGIELHPALDLALAGDPAPAGEPVTPTISGPSSVARGSLVSLTGTAAANAAVQVWFRKQGTSTFVKARDLTADANGVFGTSYRATVDDAYYAASQSLTSATAITKAIGTTLSAPRLIKKGSTATLTGLARPGQRVDVYFRGAGQTTFVDRRDLAPSSDGLWTTTFTADRDYRTYARTVEATSPQALTQVTFATIAGPANAARQATVTLTGTARAGSSVAVWFRKSGTSSYVQRRSLTATTSGTFRTTYTADASYAYYAVADGVRSANRSTSVPTTTTTSSAPGNPGDSKNCGDFSTWSDAQHWFDYYYPYYGDVAGLDADNDRIACESLPGAP